jgi:competence protein ComEC
MHPLGVMLGAGGYVWSPVEPEGWWLWLGVGVGALAVALTRRRAGGLLSFLAIFSLCLGVGALAGKVRAASVASPVLAREIGPVRVEGVVAEIDASDTSRRLRIEVRAIEGLQPAQTPKFIRIAHRAEITVGPGRNVSCLAVLSPPPRPVVPGDYEFHRDAWFRQLGGVGFAAGTCRPLPQPATADARQAVERWIGAARRGIAEHVNEAAGPGGGGMSAAMVVGDRSFLSAEDSDALRDSGLAHLLSISGVHMVLAGGIFFFLIRLVWPLWEGLALRVPAVKAAALGAIIAVTLYFAISGASVATQRAFVMAIIAFGAKLFDRPAISLRSLAVALVAVVLLQPESVATPGFQMSFGASAALIALYEIWPKMETSIGRGLFARVGGWIIGAVATSVAASAATMPFALHHFDRTAVMSVVANIVSTPIVSLWTTPAAAGAVLAAPFGWDEPFLWLMGKSLEVVLWVARWCAAFDPPIDMPRLPVAGLALASGALLAFCVLRGPARLVALAPLAGAVGLWVTAPRTAALVAGDGTVFVRAEEGWIELTDWRGENGLDPMTVRGAKSKPDCAGRGAACELGGRYGTWRVEPVAGGAMEALAVAQAEAARVEAERVEAARLEAARATDPAGTVAAGRDAGGPPLGAPAPDAGAGAASAGPSPAPSASPTPEAASSARPARRARAPRQRYLACPPNAVLVFTPVGGAETRLDPCAIGAAGGAVVEVREGRTGVRYGPSDAGRPWGRPGG